MVTNVAGDLRMPLKSLIDLRISEYKVRTGKPFIKKEAAAKLNMTPQHFSALVAGKEHTTAEKMFVLANMLECKVDDLYIYEEDRNNEPK